MLRSTISRLPVWFRKFIVDAAEGFVSSIVVLNLFIPGTVTELQAQAAMIGAAFASAAIAAFRRNAGAARRWFADLLLGSNALDIAAQDTPPPDGRD